MFDPAVEMFNFDLIVQALLLLIVVVVPWAIVSTGLGTTASEPRFADDHPLEAQLSNLS